MWDRPLQQLIEKKAGVGAGRIVARRSWLSTLEDILALPEVGAGEGKEPR